MPRGVVASGLAGVGEGSCGGGLEMWGFERREGGPAGRLLHVGARQAGQCGYVEAPARHDTHGVVRGPAVAAADASGGSVRRCSGRGWCGGARQHQLQESTDSVRPFRADRRG